MTSTTIVTQFYRRLLELDSHDDIAPQLQRALELLVRVTTATGGFLELFGDPTVPLSCTASLTEEARNAVRAATARGVIAHAISEGRSVVLSATARELPTELIGLRVAIACAPIVRDASIGVVYLHGPRAFSTTQVQHLELFARRISPLCALLMPPRTLEEQMALARRQIIRQELRRNGWNMTSTARALGVGRAALYRALRTK